MVPSQKKKKKKSPVRNTQDKAVATAAARDHPAVLFRLSRLHHQRVPAREPERTMATSKPKRTNQIQSSRLAGQRLPAHPKRHHPRPSRLKCRPTNRPKQHYQASPGIPRASIKKNSYQPPPLARHREPAALPRPQHHRHHRDIMLPQRYHLNSGLGNGYRTKSKLSVLIAKKLHTTPKKKMHKKR